MISGLKAINKKEETLFTISLQSREKIFAECIIPTQYEKLAELSN